VNLNQKEKMMKFILTSEDNIKKNNRTETFKALVNEYQHRYCNLWGHWGRADCGGGAFHKGEVGAFAVNWNYELCVGGVKMSDTSLLCLVPLEHVGDVEEGVILEMSEEEFMKSKYDYYTRGEESWEIYHHEGVLKLDLSEPED
jgi:hypothetical protein